ncbi:MAG TPA: hypothetical protein PK405_05125 [Hyphomicrobiales bacterium]|nr:hypothetical protein [Hyphomicrobiales bacterium]
MPAKISPQSPRWSTDMDLVTRLNMAILFAAILLVGGIVVGLF